MTVSHFRRSARLMLAVVSVAVAGGAAAASTFVRMDLDALSRQSEMVVQARVLGVSSAWNADRSMIFSRVDLQVTRGLMGPAPSRVTVRVPGGSVGDQTTRMVGAPAFEAGSEVVAFLGRWDDDVLGIMGYAQGLSLVGRDAAGKARLSGGSAHGLTVADLVMRLERMRPREEGR